MAVLFPSDEETRGSLLPANKVDLQLSENALSNDCGFLPAYYFCLRNEWGDSDVFSYEEWERDV